MLLAQAVTIAVMDDISLRLHQQPWPKLPDSEKSVWVACQANEGVTITFFGEWWRFDAGEQEYRCSKP
jgi:hypothetical protein